MKRIPPKHLDIIVADPPYGYKYKSNMRKYDKHDVIYGDDKFTFSPDFFWDKLKSTGAMYVFLSRKNLLPGNKDIYFNDKRVRNIIVWDKMKHGMGDLDKDYGDAYEVILFLPKPKFSFIGKRWSNLWKIPAVQGKHPAQKPVEVIKRIVAECPPDGLVYDPYMGSGATALACEDLNLKWVGSEILEEWYNYALERVEIRKRQLNLFGA